MVLRHSLLWLSSSQQLRGLATHTTMGRRLARRFVAGERLDDAVSVAKDLNSRGLAISLDHLGENVTDMEQARGAARDYVQILHSIDAAKLNANISVKLTQLGLAIDQQGTLENLQRILSEAERLHATVTVDMEGSPFTEQTIACVLAARQQHANVGVAIQAYLYRTVSDVEKLVQAGVCGIRLCKGAYDEPEAIAFPRKQDVDQNYRRLLEILLRQGCYPLIATHDPELIQTATQMIREMDIPRAAFEFQMLYGIRRDLQERLIRSGYALRIYVPYGTEWYGYLMRRLAERPANLLFFVRSLVSEALPNHRQRSAA